MKKRSLSEEMTRGKAPKGKEPAKYGLRVTKSERYVPESGKPTYRPMPAGALPRHRTDAFTKKVPVRKVGDYRSMFNARKEYSE